MYTVREISEKLNAAFPYERALSYDNVGLLVGRGEKEVKRILVALDVTSAVVKEAVKLGASLIVSHHPVIFREMKRVTDEGYTGSIVLDLAENGIAAIALHTNYDCAEEGNNHHLARALGAKDFEVLEDGFALAFDLEEEMPIEAFSEKVRLALSEAVLRVIGEGRVKTVITSCGAGISESLILLAKERNACIVTADVKHNYASMAADLGVKIVETTHYASEWAFAKNMANHLAKEFDGVEVFVSKENINPYA